MRPVGGSPPVPGERMGNGAVVVVVPDPTASLGTVVVVEWVVMTVVAATVVVLGIVPVVELTAVPRTVVDVTAGPEKTAGLVVELVEVLPGR